MWQIWTISQDTKQRPSDLMNISAWASDLTGIPNDWWTAFQFDAAVSWFGRHVENKLMERDKEGQPRYKLESLLADRAHAGNAENLRVLKHLVRTRQG